MNYKELSGKTVVVTGASSGIGQAIALYLGKQGMNVVVNYYKAEKEGEEVVKQIIESKSKAICVQGDVSKEKDLQNLLDKTLKEFNGLDLWINNAGLQIQSPSHLVQLKEWQKVIDTNLTGVFIGCKLATNREILSISLVFTSKYHALSMQVTLQAKLQCKCLVKPWL